MALHLPYGIALINPKANIDEHYGPYMSVEAANAAVPIAIRAVGRTVGILDSETNKITEYWWQCGIADDNLVEKTADVALLHALSTSKADKVTGATNGDIAGLDANGNLKDSGKSINDFKLKQQNVVDPTASGESITFIDSISQNEDGVIAPIKKTVKTATSASGDVPAAAGLMSSSDKSKLDSIANGAQVNVIEGVKVNGQLVVPDSDKNANVTIQNPDWNQTTSAESDYIKNKPALKSGQGVNSIIEGDIDNNVAGNYSHAEGSYTTASGYYSHAEGGYTTASDDFSHAEGQATTASGYKSHAEGSGTTASGIESHAEGSGTKASGYGSHAEGGSTTASGQNSHAEGTGTTAKNKSQHAFGEYNIDDPSLNSASTRGNYVEIVGNGASGARSNARTLDWSGNEVLAGTITANGVNLNDELNLKQDALGFTPENVANKKTTLDDNSDTYYPTQKAVKTAVDAKVTGAASSVANEVPVYDGTTGKVLKSGSGVSAVGGNLTIGGTITVNGQQILPQKQTDWNQTTSTESDYIKNKPAIKAGQGVSSIIEGDGTKASGSSSHAEGYQTQATEKYSHAEGQLTTTSGQQSHAEGYQTTAGGASSHAEGGYTTASGSSSHAEGYGTTASGLSSHAEGGGTTANHKNQHVVGEYNIADPSINPATVHGNYVEIVGNGTDNTHRSNARTLDWSGNEVLAGKITANGVNLNDALNLKQNALGFTPEDLVNKKTTLVDNSDTYYPTQKAVKTAVDAKVEGPNSSVANTLPAFADETGKLLKGDTGVSIVNSEIIAGGVNINSAIAGIPTQISNALTLLDGELAFIFRES